MSGTSSCALATARSGSLAAVLCVRSGCRILPEIISSGMDPDRSDAVPRLDVDDESQPPGMWPCEEAAGAALMALMYMLSDVSGEERLNLTDRGRFPHQALTCAHC